MKRSLIRWALFLKGKAWQTVRYIPVVLIVLMFVIFFIGPLITSKSLIFRIQRGTQDEIVYDLFLISSYYYPNSTSLGDNAVSLLLTGNYEAIKMGGLRIIAWNDTANAIISLPLARITPHNVCHWISMKALGTTLPNMTNMALILGGRYQNIPYRLPEYRKYDVVTCVAPLFANEQWQYALFAAHTYKRFGAFMHLYVRSMVTPMLEMLKIYEKEGYLRIQPWMRINLQTIDEDLFNPNINIEFRNQAAAQTDCLLQYKESASYISFMDLDDILIPRIGKTYLDEYNYFFTVLPQAAYIHYSKENVAVKGQRSPEKFSLAQMYSSIYFKQVNETGKFVTRPHLINATWIHWPTHIQRNMQSYVIPPNLNAITHLKLMDDDTSPADRNMIREPLFEPKIYFENEVVFTNSTERKPLLYRRDIAWIQEDLERMLRIPEVKALFALLPKDLFYFNIILKCFNDTYYQYHYSGQMNKITCPGPERCHFPANPGINCSNSDGDYLSTSDNKLVNIHFVTQQHFRVEDGCKP
ncbi:unnamed protein product, partial [Mesorhabditis belari]|uniref:Glycosyltransferase family 92 protein n=1 Tax=Mesorhabditis belari TaxID=2138241 RepID=A0AAF3ESY1_9BILA